MQKLKLYDYEKKQRSRVMPQIKDIMNKTEETEEYRNIENKNDLFNSETLSYYINQSFRQHQPEQTSNKRKSMIVD